MRPTVGKIARRKFLFSPALFSLFPKIAAAESLIQTNQASTNKSFAANAAKIVNLNDLLEPLRASGKVPALASAVIVEGKIKGVGAVGIRKGGSPIAVKGTDLWHVGSCTKAMTATLIAFEVERKKMQWDMTVADALPDLQKTM